MTPAVEFFLTVFNTPGVLSVANMYKAHWKANSNNQGCQVSATFHFNYFSKKKTHERLEVSLENWAMEKWNMLPFSQSLQGQNDYIIYSMKFWSFALKLDCSGCCTFFLTSPSWSPGQ